MSSDTRSEGPGGKQLNPEARAAQKPSVPPPDDLVDDDGDEATVMARVPEELLAEIRGAESTGLRQMFAREPVVAPSGRPTQPGEEPDALLDMLFDDARDERRAAATPPPAAARKPPPKAPPPMPVRAIPPPAPVPEKDATAPGDDEAMVDVDAGESPVAPAIETAAASGLLRDESDDEPAAPPSSGNAPRIAIPSKQPPPAAFEREEDASALLIRMQQRDAWVARAEWLRGEAGALQDPGAKARGLMVVSELFAMSGEDAHARATAEEARALAPTAPLPHRQVRGLLMREGDWAGALEALEAETRTSPTADAKVHGALLGAEIARLNLSDEEGAKKRVEQAIRVVAGDPRAHVQRFAEALAAADPEDGTPAAAKIKLPDLAELRPLAAAIQLVLAHRGITPATATGKPASSRGPSPSSTYEALLRVRVAIAAGDHAAVVAGLEALALVPSLAGGAGWLAGVVAAANKETRPRSVAAFRGLISGTHGSLARRALAARAIELGDAAAASAATESAGSDAFSAADRIALAALVGGSRKDVDPWIDALLGDPELAPVAGAASAALAAGSDSPVHAVGTLRSRTSTTLGRALASLKDAPEGFRGAVASFSDAATDSAVGRMLALEIDIDANAGGKIARAVASFRDDVETVSERAIAGAVIAEAAGEASRARQEYERVRESEPGNEAVARACLAHAETDAEGAKIISEHAQALKADARAAVLLTEAAVRIAAAGDAAESEALLRRALEADAQIPLAAHLGERAARARGDRDALVEWIRSRRETSRDPVEQAHDLVREALLISEGDAAAAAPLLEQALRARPSDVALREIFERLSPDPLPDRASWRVARAAEATGLEAARLTLEAALELERAGDLEGASRCAQKAIAAGDQLLAPITAYRAAVAGHGTADTLEVLLARVRESSDTNERRELYERLAELDERGRGDTAGALVWRRTILEENPGHLPTLRRVASALIGSGREDEFEPIALDIARALSGPEAVAHAMVSARLRQRLRIWDETREAVEIAYKFQPRGIWALRQMAAHARASGDHALALEADGELIERTDRPSEQATLSLRSAESAVISAQVEDGLSFLAHSIELAPSHIVPHLALAIVLEKTGNSAGSAAALEAAANAAVSPAEKAHNLYRAALLWQDKVSDVARARAALEAVAEIDPSHGEVFPRLQAIYVSEGARAELAALLKKRLDAVTDPAERVEMEVLRGRALADVGDAAAAKRALAAALEQSPDHVDALGAFADVAAAEEDWSGAEQAWIRLARLIPDADRQAAIYLRLGGLYDEHLPNPERAELAYQEILKRQPSDTLARERLVALYQRIGDPARAIEEQTQLINAAEAPELKSERTAQLARIYEVAGDAKKAESTLLQARKTWPKDDVALASLARFYQRNNQQPAANVLLDRAVADARRALGTGRFEPYLFSTIATVAELRSRPDAARVAQAAVAALEGNDAALDGAGIAAGDESLDEMLAPEVMTAAFRELLKKTGPLLDTAVPFDGGSVRAAPLLPNQAELGDLIRTMAGGYGLDEVQILGSSVLGSVCVPASAHPPVLVVGHALIASTNEEVRSFLIHRALKVLDTNAAAFSRTAPIDLWPLLAAYLKVFSPGWTPQGVDQGKLNDFHGRLSKALPKGLPANLGTLAAEVIGAIGNRASTLNTVINGWGNRAGLLATGDLNVAIAGIAWAGGHTNAPPANGKERMTWIGRNAEARELVVFSVSDPYADARTRLGLGG